MGTNTFELIIDNQVKAITSIEIRDELEFIARLERKEDYNGEFGFDWMRSNYETICQSYEALKQEYNPTKIEGQDYFIPWLSMFPKQENVSLLLKIDKLNDEKLKRMM